MICRGCGNEIDADQPCGICAVAEERRRLRRVLCPGCGNEKDPDGDCEVCAVRAEESAARRPAAESREQFCVACGNVYEGAGDCPICQAGRGGRRKTKLTMCLGCGNEVEDVLQCPICQDGRSIAGRKPQEDRGPVCPECNDVLEEQVWDGVDVLMCNSCQGVLFAPGGLEETLDKLRQTVVGGDLSLLIDEYRQKRCLHLPKEVRYKPCPVCHLSMTRRNYKRISGIIIDVCGKHGTWVGQHTFGELTDFVTQGGDAFAKRWD